MTNNNSKPYYPNEYYAQLLFYAKSDLEWAKSKLERTNYFYHKPCFEARECVEKSLKAFLEASGKAAPEFHSLRTLIDLCGHVDKEFLRLRSRWSILQPFTALAENQCLAVGISAFFIHLSSTGLYSSTTEEVASPDHPPMA